MRSDNVVHGITPLTTVEPDCSVACLRPLPRFPGGMKADTALGQMRGEVVIIPTSTGQVQASIKEV